MDTANRWFDSIPYVSAEVMIVFVVVAVIGLAIWGFWKE